MSAGFSPLWAGVPPLLIVIILANNGNSFQSMWEGNEDHSSGARLAREPTLVSHSLVA